jgi:phytoene synthase
MNPDDLVCERLLKQGSKSFHLASRALPSRVRGPTRAIYAFCRTTDDAVDGGGDPRAAAEQLEHRLDRIYADTSLDDAVDRAFARVVQSFRIPRAVPAALVEGMRWDAEGRRYETLGDLQAYAARVASSVGVMMTLVMGDRSPWVLARACDLGVAMQLTNIARDVGEDARMGRLYLPGAWLTEVGLDAGAFLDNPRPGEPIALLVRRLLGEAQAAYRRAGPGIDRLPRDCQFAIQAASLLYAGIGGVIARRGFDSVSSRAVVSLPHKLWLLLRAAWRTPPRPQLAGASLEAPVGCLPAAAFLVRAVAEIDAAPALEAAA